MPESVTIFEVGPRDGLQNERRPIATSDKIRLVDMLSRCGLKKIETTSFVSPKAVPQMSDAAEVMRGIQRVPGIVYAVLTPNLKGYEAARAARAGEVAVFASASEGFSQKNINCSIEESLTRFRPVLEAAKADHVPVRGYVSCVIRCPYDGWVAPAAVASVARRLMAMGCYEISLGDTIGAGTPEAVETMLSVLTAELSPVRLAGHFHDTHGRALDNIEVCVDHGVRVFDSSVAGLGGCPYAPGAPGNVDTVAVAKRMAALGFATGLDIALLEEAAEFARSLRVAA
jgi:hydroxymethylglutaryl-CoA lyase